MENRSYREQLEEQLMDRAAEVRRRDEEIALRLLRAAEYRDDETGLHVQRVGALAAGLARALGWNRDAANSIRLAAAMHDIGKVAVPDRILLRPGKLTELEFELVKKHTEVGAALLAESDIPLLEMAHDIALFHHEWWNGTGYPQGKSGLEIPESARITAIADVYDVLLHEQAYRPAMPEGQALGVMTDERGSHFDPAMLDRFLSVLGDLRTVLQAMESPREHLAVGHAMER